MEMKSRLSNARVTVGAAVLLAGISLATGAFGAQRPISDFLSRQGHWCVNFDTSGNIICPSEYGDLACGFLFVPPVADYVGWGDPKSNIGMSIDYAGLADQALGGALGTTMTGSVNERPLPDGRAEVEVVLHTRNALTWAQEGFLDFNNAPLLFGVRARDVLAGATPSLGSCTFRLRFINSAPGAALPDLMELEFCHFSDLEVLSISGQASGTLADGRPGRLEVVQTGLIQTAGIANPNSRVALDAFPAEKITVQATGR